MCSMCITKSIANSLPAKIAPNEFDMCLGETGRCSPSIYVWNICDARSKRDVRLTSFEYDQSELGLDAAPATRMRPHPLSSLLCHVNFLVVLGPPPGGPPLRPFCRHPPCGPQSHSAPAYVSPRRPSRSSATSTSTARPCSCESRSQTRGPSAHAQ